MWRGMADCTITCTTMTITATLCCCLSFLPMFYIYNSVILHVDHIDQVDLYLSFCLFYLSHQSYFIPLTLSSVQHSLWTQSDYNGPPFITWQTQPKTNGLLKPKRKVLRNFSYFSRIYEGLRHQCKSSLFIEFRIQRVTVTLYYWSSAFDICN